MDHAWIKCNACGRMFCHLSEVQSPQETAGVCLRCREQIQVDRPKVIRSYATDDEMENLPKDDFEDEDDPHEEGEEEEEEEETDEEEEDLGPSTPHGSPTNSSGPIHSAEVTGDPDLKEIEETLGWAAGRLESRPIFTGFPLDEQAVEEIEASSESEPDDSSVDDLDSDFYEGRTDEVGRLAAEEHLLRMEREDTEDTEAEDSAAEAERELDNYYAEAEARAIEQHIWSLVKEHKAPPDASDYDYDVFDDDGADEAGSAVEGPPKLAYGQPRESISRPVAFWLDAGGFHPYLLFTKKPDSVPVVVQRLRDLGIEPGIAGHSRRPASNGRQYSFYIRLGKLPQSGEDLSAALSDLDILPQGIESGSPEKVNPPESVADHTSAALPDEARGVGGSEDLFDSIGQEDEENAPHLPAVTPPWQALATSLARRLVIEVAEGKKRREALKWHSRERQEAFESLRKAREDRSQLDDLLGHHEALLNEHDALRAMHDRALAEITGLTATREGLREECDGLRNRIGQLQFLLEEAKHSKGMAAPEPTEERVKVDVRAVIGHLCPHVELLRHSLTTIEQECPDFRGVFSVLYRLQTKTQMKAERVEGAPKWREVHFGTGRSDDGRAYFTMAGDKVHVLLSLKERQKRDIQWLVRN